MRYHAKSWLAALCLLTQSYALSEIPAGYYDSCEGKSGQALLKALNAKIANHTNVGYDGLWNVYKQSDVRADGTLWDIYSTKAWSTNFTKCGNYKLVGDCVNREHSLPKSWWGGGKSAQYSDAFHLYPTDGKVNGQRSNYPFGECSNGTRLPNNGNVQPLGRLGYSTFPGYSGQVFEPDNEYKGDLARSYFYMVACYNAIISGWTQGNGNNFFAGNSYPAFKTWATDLLLKWTRQDPVSQKEINRNDAIYQYQHNRNPFIDHPEMAEHIWGDKQNEPWSATPAREPEIIIPAKNTEINMGYAAVNIPRSIPVAIKSKYLNESVTLSATGQYSVTPTRLSAEQANNGTEVTVTLTAHEEGTAEGVLTIISGAVIRTVDLTAEAENGLPVTITDVSSNGFYVNWINIDSPATDYTIHVKQGSQYVPGFPATAVSSLETYRVTGLDPLTRYSVQVTTPGIQSSVHTITTPDLIPSIQLLFDGDLDFSAVPGEPSDIAELLMDVENVAEDITVTVNTPFEVSSDKSEWNKSITLDPEEDRFYLRVNSAVAGEFTTDIILSAGSYIFDNTEASATVAAPVTFLEDWEEAATTSVPAYSSTTFKGSAALWAVTDGGFGSATQDKSFNGTTVLRMGKDSTSSIAMAEDKTGGIGTVSFDAAKWSESEATAVLEFEYSTDGGIIWTSAGKVTVDNSSSKNFTATVNCSGNARIRLRQTSGKRWFVDNIGISNYSAIDALQNLEYHSWDAFCRNGQLVIEISNASTPVAVYGMDGLTWLNENLTPGTHAYTIPKGLYVVVSRDFTRRVLVK